MANHQRVITVTVDDRRILESLVRAPTTPAGLSRRARAVLLMADGTAGTAIAERTGYSPVQISRLHARYATEGVLGLGDRPRPGRPAEVSAAQRARILALTLKPPPAGLSHWSTRELAQHVGVSASTVQRLWRAHALQPHRRQTFKFTTDPAAAAKIEDVVGLYLAPPTNAVVLSVDEKTQIQALERTQPLLPLRPQLPARQTHDYYRHGLTSLYAALEVGSGRVTGACSPRHTGADFLRFLKHLARTYPRQALHVILDNSSTHSTPAVHAWLAAHPRIQFHFTPTGASWLNLIEAWFGVLTRQSVRRGSFRSVRALVQHIKRYLDHWNADPKPFVWTKTPAEIIRKAVRR